MLFPRISIRCRRLCRASIDLIFLGGLVLLLGAAPVRAQKSRLADIRARGALSCAAYPRPGVAEAQTGLLRDLCRAIAAAVIGPGAKSDLAMLAPPQDAQKLRDRAYDVVFLTADEASGAESSLVQGPAAFIGGYGLLVEESSSFRKPEDLAGQSVCFLASQPAISALEQDFTQKHLEFVRVPFEEADEMRDAYNVRHCRAMVGEESELAASRREKGVLAFDSRLLAPPLKNFSIFAFTPRPTADRDIGWEATVAQIFKFLLPRDGGADAADPPAGGLSPDWRQNLLAATGDYDAMFAKNLGANSTLKLARQELPAAPARANNLRELFAFLGACLRDVPAPPGAQLTISFSLKRDGALLGKPHVAFLRAPRDAMRRDLLDAMAEKFAFCLPAPITDGLGGAIAGRPLTVRFGGPQTAEKPI